MTIVSSSWSLLPISISLIYPKTFRGYFSFIYSSLTYTAGDYSCTRRAWNKCKYDYQIIQLRDINVHTNCGRSYSALVSQQFHLGGACCGGESLRGSEPQGKVLLSHSPLHRSSEHNQARDPAFTMVTYGHICFE